VIKIISAMKRINKKVNAKTSDDFTLVEKLIVLYCGLRVAREIFFTTTDIAFLKNKISEKEKKDWEHFFDDEYARCKKIDIRTYRGCAWLEYKVRHLMDLAVNISFGKKKVWKGYTVSFENIIFPVLDFASHKNS
jgi:spermidine/putrescine-binding protein